jgi:hypothetical protein
MRPVPGRYAVAIGLAVIIHVDAGRFGEGRPLALLRGPGAGDGCGRRSVLYGISPVGHSFIVNSVLHGALLSLTSGMQTIDRQNRTVATRAIVVVLTIGEHAVRVTKI